MSKKGALLQVILVVLLLAYSTLQFYRGRFDLGFSILPLLMLYYVFVIGRSRRLSRTDEDEPNGDSRPEV
jgi:hypothetical protein